MGDAVFLKAIELFGFKSFADRCRIEFSEGISALLGPNGCGKSNVVDAIKWVLGEQSTKTLRADRMEDVIFNGTENRKPLNVAEVTLILSNDSGILPVEISEIAVKRRLYRSGESEYFVNNTMVKLKELRELFYDTGIGKSAYSIMEQGKIDQVLSNKPEERRFIFEEAAGITKFKIKGQEAERKLEKTEENMRQVEGILGEVKRSYDSLRVQAEKTIQYREMREKSFELELDIQLLRLKGFLEDKARKEEQLSDRIKQRDTIKTEIDKINESLEANLDMVNSMEASLIETQKKLYGIDLEKNNRQAQVGILTERMGEIENQIALDLSREKSIQEKLFSLKKEVVQKESSLTELTERLKEVGKNIEEFEKNIEVANLRIRENDKTIGTAEKEIESLEHERDLLQKELRVLTDDIVTQLDQKLKESGYSFHERKVSEEAIQKTLSSLHILVTGKAQLLEDSMQLGNDSGKDHAKLLELSLSALKESESLIQELINHFERYEKLTPVFLDEFLAPEGTITKKREIDEKLVSVYRGIGERRKKAEEARTENKTLVQKIEEYRKTLEDLRVNLVRMKTQSSAAEEALQRLRKEICEQDIHLEDNARKIEQGKERLVEITTQIGKLEEERSRLEEEEKKLKTELLKLEEGISTKNKDLVSKEKLLKLRMEDLGKNQSHLERIQMELAQVQVEIKNLYDNFKERHSRDLSEFEGRTYEIRTPSKDLRDQLNDIREKQKNLGQVNLMAPEEFAEVKERYEFLNNQLNDLKKGREDLKRITQEIRTESAELFLETYDKIKKNFHLMFRRLFGGGRAELKLVDSDNVLESGIEIFAQPPGKKLENIALLSGGERSLTAIGLLFATYMVKPSPFCILDEIDAALDESNVGRFVNLLQEFGASSQFIVITHNKKTVAAASTLLGVTMEESGISKLVAIRLTEQGEPVGIKID